MGQTTCTTTKNFLAASAQHDMLVSTEQAARGARKGFNPPLASINLAFFQSEIARARQNRSKVCHAQGITIADKSSAGAS